MPAVLWPISAPTHCFGSREDTTEGKENESSSRKQYFIQQRLFPSDPANDFESWLGSPK